MQNNLGSQPYEFISLNWGSKISGITVEKLLFLPDIIVLYPHLSATSIMWIAIWNSFWENGLESDYALLRIWCTVECPLARQVETRKKALLPGGHALTSITSNCIYYFRVSICSNFFNIVSTVSEKIILVQSWIQ